MNYLAYTEMRGIGFLIQVIFNTFIIRVSLDLHFQTLAD